MVSSSKAKGSAYERLVREYLRDADMHVEHLRLNGTDDMGDLYVAGRDAVLELKAVKRIMLPEFLRQAELEAGNYAKAHRRDQRPAFFAVVKASGQHVGKSFVVTTLDEWIARG